MFLNLRFKSGHGAKPLVQVTIIRLIGYREWTETLGSDREHVIQGIQAQLHRELVNGFSKVNAWAHPLRYDYLFAITNGVNREGLMSVIKDLASTARFLYRVGRMQVTIQGSRKRRPLN